MLQLEPGWTSNISLPHTNVPSHATFATLIIKSDGVWLVVSSKKESRIAHSVILSVSFIDIRLLL